VLCRYAGGRAFGARANISATTAEAVAGSAAVAAADPALAVKEAAAGTYQGAAVTDPERAAAGPASLAHWTTMPVAPIAAQGSAPAPKKDDRLAGAEPPELVVRRTLRMA